VINLYCIRPKGFNIGNDVIFLGLQHFLRQAFPEPVNLISLPATSRYEAHKKAGISAETVYEINRFGHGLIVGGGNLYENGELEVNPTALRALEVPLLLFSLSRGRIFNRDRRLVDRTNVMPDERVKLLNARAEISLSRDRATHDYLEGIGCPTLVCGCPTLFIDEMPHHADPVVGRDRTDALLSIRSPHLMSVPVADQYRVREDIRRVLELLAGRGYAAVKLLCHDHRDIPFAASFPGVDYAYTEDVFAYLTLLRSTRLAVTYRLHAFLPCLSFGTPAIPISYDERGADAAATVGMGDWDIPMMDRDVPAAVADRLDRLESFGVAREELRRGRWRELHGVLLDACRRFAALVRGR
jgi:hypothetical protein